MKKIIVIGGGPAGMMAAGIAAGRGHETLLLEKNDRLGKKLAITGKGRCNLTNASDPEELMANTPGHPEFLYSAFYTFGSDHLMAFFEQLGVPLQIERGKRVFPQSGRAGDIVAALEMFLRRSRVKIKLNTPAEAIRQSSGRVDAVKIQSGAWESADGVVLATGGLSYPSTGSTGDGHRFARALGHQVTDLLPSLVPLRTAEKWPAELQGLSLKNTAVTLIRKENQKQKILYQDFGELLFTHFGVSGPVVLSASRFVTGSDASRPVLSMDLKPALSEKELDLRVLRDFAQYQNKNFAHSLGDLLPKKMIPVMVRLSDIPPDKKVHDVTKEERGRFVRLLKNLELTILGNMGFQEAVITQGGVAVHEADPSAMRSKRIPNLFFAGEILDVDALTGGFNLQIAFSTGFLAGTHC
ncbi:MAG: NAD(P)/FAD-dependent oxidoreductase [Clostridiales bacterium]|jgi:predicted Rossmann fold flavoprotein|nr:NAD(P)/FAD-dependent oxidoreductase [Clostridiales bacterium]